VITPLAGRAKRKVLAIIYSNGSALGLREVKPIARDRLCGLIWPEIAEGNGRNALNTELWRLRGAIKQVGGDTLSWLETTVTSVCLLGEKGLRLDLPKFRL
jgi:DNA-binding SARP family transcriptional activator